MKEGVRNSIQRVKKVILGRGEAKANEEKCECLSLELETREAIEKYQ